MDIYPSIGQKIQERTTKNLWMAALCSTRVFLKSAVYFPSIFSCDAGVQHVNLLNEGVTGGNALNTRFFRSNIFISNTRLQLVKK